MDQVTFTLPNISEEDMGKDAQYKLIKAQAIAVILSNYLAYLLELDRLHDHQGWRITTSEIGDLINTLQAALD